MELLQVRHGDILADPLQAAESLRRFLGLPVEAKVLAAVVDSKLYRSKTV